MNAFEQLLDLLSEAKVYAPDATPASKAENFNEKEMKVPLSPDEEAKAFTRIKGSSYFIFREAPFLGEILRKLTIVMTYDVPTMAVDREGNIYINPRFALKFLSINECIGVLAHECMHHATLTFDRCHGRHHELWNVATDYIMNRDLLRSGFVLPTMGCCPRLEDNGEKAFVDIKKHGKVIKTIDISNISAEKLYKELLSASKEHGLGSASDLGEPIDSVIGGGKEGKEGSEGSSSGKPRPIPGSNQPGKMSPEDMRRAVNIADQISKHEQEELEQRHRENKEKSQGGGPGSSRHHVLKQHTPKVNWRQILKQIIVQTATRYDNRKPAKRPLSAGVYLPKSITYDELPLISVVLDTSGSMGPAEINAFLSEIKSIYRFYSNAQVLVLLCHTQVYYQAFINKGNINTKIPEIVANVQGGGGIDIQPVGDYIKAKHLDTKVQAIIFLTDGWYCDGKIPTLLTSGGRIKNYALVNDIHGMEAIQKIPGMKCFFTEFK